MKVIHFIALFTFVSLLGCNQSPAEKVSKIESGEVKSETPKKKIAEQFSSPDNNKTIPTKQVAQATEDKIESDAKPEKVASNNTNDVEIPKPVEQKKETPTFVKTVSKPAVKVVKKRVAEIEFDDMLFDFGEIMQGDKVDHKFTFTNTGRAPLSITEADATCGCATPSIPFMDIMPGEKGYIGVNYNSVGKEGEETPQVTIYSNASKHPIMVLKLKGYVKTPEEAKAELMANKSAMKDSIILEAKDSTKTEVKQ